MIVFHGGVAAACSPVAIDRRATRITRMIVTTPSSPIAKRPQRTRSPRFPSVMRGASWSSTRSGSGPSGAQIEKETTQARSPRRHRRDAREKINSVIPRPPLPQLEVHRERHVRLDVSIESGMELVMIPEHEQVLDGVRLLVVDDVLLAQRRDALRRRRTAWRPPRRWAWGLRGDGAAGPPSRRQLGLAPAPVGNHSAFQVPCLGPLVRRRAVLGLSSALAATGGV